MSSKVSSTSPTRRVPPPGRCSRSHTLVVNIPPGGDDGRRPLER